MSAKLTSENKEIDGSDGLLEAILAYEEKTGVKFPNKCNLKMLNYYDDGNVLSIGFIHNSFIKRVNEKYEIYRDKKELKMSVVKLSTAENERTIAFWLQEIEFLEQKMKEINAKEGA